MSQIVNPAAFDAMKLCQDLASGYYSHAAAIETVKHPRVNELLPEILPGQRVPVGLIPSRGIGGHEYDFRYYLRLIKEEPLIQSEMDRLWAYGSILRLGDELAKNNYFDRPPELELLRHLRNGVAHGNKFDIRGPVKLAKYPAHNKLVSFRDLVFEITPALDGTNVLFDFICLGDLITLFQDIGAYLSRLASGDKLRP